MRQFYFIVLVIFFFTFSSFGQKVSLQKGVFKRSEFFYSLKQTNHAKAIRDLVIPIMKANDNQVDFRNMESWLHRLCIYALALEFEMTEGLEDEQKLINDIEFVFNQVDYFTSDDIDCIQSYVLRNKASATSHCPQMNSLQYKVRRFLLENIDELYVDENGNEFEILKSNDIEWENGGTRKYVSKFNEKSELVEMIEYDYSGCRIVNYRNNLQDYEYQKYSKDGILLGEGNSYPSDSLYRINYFLNGKISSQSLTLEPNYHYSAEFSENGDTLYYRLIDCRATSARDYIYRYDIAQEESGGLTNFMLINDELELDELGKYINLKSKDDFLRTERMFYSILNSSNDTAICTSKSLQILDDSDSINISRLKPFVRVACDMLNFASEVYEIETDIEPGIKEIKRSFTELEGRINNPELLELHAKFYFTISISGPEKWSDIRDLYLALRPKMNEEERREMFIFCMNKIFKHLKVKSASNNNHIESVDKLNKLDSIAVNFKNELTPIFTEYLNTLSEDEVEHLKIFQQKYNNYLKVRLQAEKEKQFNKNYNLFATENEKSTLINAYLKNVAHLKFSKNFKEEIVNEDLHLIISKFDNIFTPRDNDKSMELQNHKFNHFKQLLLILDDDIDLARELFSPDESYYNLLGWLLMFIDEN